jgi:hypothetical protein
VKKKSLQRSRNMSAGSRRKRENRRSALRHHPLLLQNRSLGRMVVASLSARQTKDMGEEKEAAAV